MPQQTPLASEPAHEPTPVGRFRPASGPQMPETDLARYLGVLWAHRRTILATTLLAAAAALVGSLLVPRQYEAEVTLVVSRPKIADGVTDTTAVANFIPLVAATNVAAQVIKELGLNRAPHNAAPSTFFDKLVTVEEVRNSTILIVKGRLSDPDLAARMVNRVAEIGAEAARRTSQQEAVQARDDIKLQFEESSQRLAQAEDRLQKYRQTAQVEVLKKDVEAALKEREGLLKLQIDIEAERSKLATGRAELVGRQHIDVLKRSIDSEPVLLESARKAAEGQSKDPLALQLTTEQTNPVYEEIDKIVAKSRAELAALEQRKAQLTARKLVGDQYDKLTKLYEAEAQISRLEMERDLSRKVYQEVASRYETTRLMIAGRSSALQIITPASVPDQPASRNIGRNLFIGLFSGLVIASLAILVLAAASPDWAR